MTPLSAFLKPSHQAACLLQNRKWCTNYQGIQRVERFRFLAIVYQNFGQTECATAISGSTLNGKVLKIGTLPQSDGWGGGGGVKMYETEISIDDLPADAGLKPGMTAEAKILINVIADARLVPVQAVAEFEGSSIVYVVGSSGIERKVVTVGESNDLYIQILDGLETGESVALDARVRAASELKAAGPQGAKPAQVPAPSGSKADPK